MRKLIITFLILVLTIYLSFTSVFSQEQMNIKKGLKIGLNKSKFVGNEEYLTEDYLESDPNKIAGTGFGGFIEFNITSHFSIQPELLYVKRGTQYILTGWSVIGPYTLKIDYVEIPILFKYNIPIIENITPSLYFGPTVAFPVKKKLETVSYNSIHDSTNEYKLENVRNPVFGVAFGGEIEISGELTLEGRFNFGLSKINGDELIERTGDPFPLHPNMEIKNRSILFMIGHSF